MTTVFVLMHTYLDPDCDEREQYEAVFSTPEKAIEEARRRHESSTMYVEEAKQFDKLRAWYIKYQGQFSDGPVYIVYEQTLDKVGSVG